MEGTDVRNLARAFVPLLLAGGLAGCVGYSDGSYGYGNSGYDAAPAYYSPGYSPGYGYSSGQNYGYSPGYSPGYGYSSGQNYGYSPGYSTGFSYYGGSGGYGNGGSGDWQRHWNGTDGQRGRTWQNTSSQDGQQHRWKNGGRNADVDHYAYRNQGGQQYNGRRQWQDN